MRARALAVVVTLVPTLVHAASPSLAQAETAYAALDFDQVIPLLEKAANEPLTPAEDLRRRELTALVHAIYERPALSRNAFLEVLAREPRYQPPASSAPKIRSAFADALSARAAMGVTPPTPITSKWWFWAGIGAVALAGIVVAGVAASQDAPEHDYGPYALP